jgi:hypothetical protein
LLDLGFKPGDESSISAGKKLVSEYIPFFTSAIKTLWKAAPIAHVLSWDAIIAATKDTNFFKNYPDQLVELNPDLVRSPNNVHQSPF